MIEMKNLDYYEFLQISPNADSDTIHRVYRFLAARFHPDNPVSGDPEKFFMLKTAYDVLSDSDKRAEYDVSRQSDEADETPLSSSVDFMDQFEGEQNRRLAVLAVLYYRRRNHPHNPEVSLPEIEKQMGFPRDYLDFTTWYLLRKGYITRADNSDFTLTADGVDFVETQRVNMPVLNKMLTNGTTVASFSKHDDLETDGVVHGAEAARAHGAGRRTIILPDMSVHTDRRTGQPDLREDRTERRATLRLGS
ncbi:MAG: DnaJ domain-containing protein [Terracidiphilus sp.]|jgi:curved DNA-binding protein CbpA